MSFFFNFIVNPSEAVYNISRKDIGYDGFLVLLLAAFSVVSGVSLIFNQSAQIISYSLTGGMVLRLIIFSFFIYLIAVFYHYFACLLGGVGSGGKLFKALPYTLITFCFVAPVALILKVIGGGFSIFFLIFILIIFVYRTLYIQVKMISYFYGLSPFSSAVSVLAPWVICGSVAVILPVVFIISLVVSL